MQILHTATSANRFLHFNLGAENYAIPLLSVREVVAMPTVTALPETPPYFLGIMNLRGEVIPVIDLKKKLRIKETPTSEITVIICSFEDRAVGYLVDSVNSVFSSKEEDIKPSSDLGSSSYINGVFTKDKTLILMLDLIQVLNEKDRAIASSSASARAA
jgi:purine-binding chemotaxis protein CheW